MKSLVGNFPVMKLPSFSRNLPSSQPHSTRSRTPRSQSSFFHETSFSLGSTSFHQAFLNNYFLHTSTAFIKHPLRYHTSSRNTRLLHHAYRDRQEEESLAHDVGTSGVASKPPGGVAADPPGSSRQSCWHQETKQGTTTKLLSITLTDLDRRDCISIVKTHRTGRILIREWQTRMMTMITPNPIRS